MESIGLSLRRLALGCLASAGAATAIVALSILLGSTSAHAEDESTGLLDSLTEPVATATSEVLDEAAGTISATAKAVGSAAAPIASAPIASAPPALPVPPVEQTSRPEPADRGESTSTSVLISTSVPVSTSVPTSKSVPSPGDAVGALADGHTDVGDTVSTALAAVEGLTSGVQSTALDRALTPLSRLIACAADGIDRVLESLDESATATIDVITATADPNDPPLVIDERQAIGAAQADEQAIERSSEWSDYGTPVPRAGSAQDPGPSVGPDDGRSDRPIVPSGPASPSGSGGSSGGAVALLTSSDVFAPSTSATTPGTGPGAPPSAPIFDTDVSPD